MMFFQKLLSLLSALTVFLGSFSGFFGGGREKWDTVTELKPLPGDRVEELSDNPNRGFRLEIAFQDLTDTGVMLNVINTQIANCAAQETHLAQVYFYLTPYRAEKVLPACVFDAVRFALNTLVEKGYLSLVRFAYQTTYQPASPEDNNGAVSTDIVLAHIEQLKSVINENKAAIYAFQVGFIGAWGEWHSDFPVLDRKAVVNAVCGALDPDIYLQVRLPEYKTDNIGLFDRNFRRIGFHNDSFFGTSRVNGSGSIIKGQKGWISDVLQAAYAPQDCELYWSCWSFENNIFCDGYEAVQGISECRMTSMSVLHGYLDYGSEALTAMRQWQSQPLTAEWLSKNDITFSKAWFTDSEGKAIPRSTFDYVCDYLGYYIEAREVKLRGNLTAGSRNRVELDLVNYGCSAMFNMESGFAILDGNGNTVSEVPAGKPQAWYNTNPGLPCSRQLLTHHVSAGLILPENPGTYTLAFYMRSKTGVYARLANDLEQKNGYSILTELAVG